MRVFKFAMIMPDLTKQSNFNIYNAHVNLFMVTYVCQYLEQSV